MPPTQRPVALPLSEPPAPEPTSPLTLLVGWGVYVFLVLVGFGFGVWTGNQKAPAETAQASANTPSPTPAPAPSTAPKTVASAPVTIPTLVPKKDTTTPAPKKPAETKTPVPAPEPKKAPAPEPKKTPEPEPKAPAVTQVSFMKEVAPIFRSKCLNCHGAAGTPKGGLDLRTLAATLKGGDGGPGVKPGDIKGGSIWASIEDQMMPPAGKEQLTEAEKTIIKNWILSGAK